MSRRDDLTRATEQARAQVEAARTALSASREARGGGPARDAREAERQLHELRDAVSDDVRILRERLTGLEPSARRGAATAAVVGAGALATLIGSGLAVRSRIRRTVEDRGVQKQALAIARAMLDETSRPTIAAGSTPRAGSGRRGGRALLTVLAVGAALAGAGLLQQRSAPVDDDDLWLPERDLGPS